MMVISGDVAINGRASGSSWSLRAYPPWTKRRAAFGSRYASSLLNIQYVASARCRATAPIELAGLSARFSDIKVTTYTKPPALWQGTYKKLLAAKPIG